MASDIDYEALGEAITVGIEDAVCNLLGVETTPEVTEALAELRAFAPSCVIYQQGAFIKFDCAVCGCRFATHWKAATYNDDNGTAVLYTACPWCGVNCYSEVPERWGADNERPK